MSEAPVGAGLEVPTNDPGPMPRLEVPEENPPVEEGDDQEAGEGAEAEPVEEGDLEDAPADDEEGSVA